MFGMAIEDRDSGATSEETLVDVLRRRATSEGARAAYTFLVDGERDEVTVSYAALETRARRIAVGLRARGAPGATVVLIFPPGLDFIAALYGCFAAGMIAVPVYPPETTNPVAGLRRVQAIAEDAGARIVLTTGAVQAWLHPWVPATPTLAGSIWCGVESLEEEPEAHGEPPVIAAEQVAFLQYTSGSTGAPKGVIVTHANILAHGAQVMARLAIDQRSVVVSWLPLYHDMGLIGTIVVPMQAGCRSVQLSPLAFLERPRRWLHAISRHGGTLSPAPNFAYDLAVRRTTDEDRRGLDLHTWVAAMNGAEPVRAETCERFARAFEPHGFRRTAFVPCYGLAEATLMVAGGPTGKPPVRVTVDGDALDGHRVVVCDDETPRARAVVGCGRVADGLEVAIVRPATGAPCDVDEVGEIWIAGPSVTGGYWARPAETAAVFDNRLADRRATFLRSGDLGFLRDGELFVTGRLKDLIVIRGRNYYPQDLELTAGRAHAALRVGGGIAFAADDGRAERLVIVHEIAADHPTTLAAAIAAIREAIVREHGIRPQTIALIPSHALPKTSSGKVRRGACRTALATGDLPVLRSWHEEVGDAIAPSQLADSSPAADLAAWLVRTIAEIRNLSPDEVGLDDSLDGLGVDSAEAAQLAVELEARLGRAIPLSLVVEHSTIRSLAVAVCEETA